jgi:hypothetical protein
MSTPASFGCSATVVELRWLLALNDDTATCNELEAFCQPCYPSILLEGPRRVVGYTRRIVVDFGKES